MTLPGFQLIIVITRQINDQSSISVQFFMIFSDILKQNDDSSKLDLKRE